MKIHEITDMIGGWFVGNFEPVAYKTPNFEVSYKVFKAGEFHEPHVHKIAVEINYLIKGTLIINGVTINSGQIFTIEPGELANPVFLEDCEMVVVKSPSVIGDKYIKTQE